MAHPKIAEDELLERLTRVFREVGFEGASLTRLVEATGLQRASLYHRFAGGKADMARAVISATTEGLRKAVVEVLEEDAEPTVKLRRALGIIERFYEGGTLSCLIEALSLGEPEEGVREGLEEALDLLQGAFAGVARECGLPTREARRRAEEVLIAIQGSLVIARVRGDGAIFRRALKRLPAVLLGEGEGGAS